MENDSAPEKGHSTKKRILIITILLVACLILGLIAFTTLMRPRITGVKSLIAANVRAQAKVKSYHMDGDVNMDITLEDEKFQALQSVLDLKLPVRMTLSADSGTETAHVITDAKVSILGKKVPVKTSELYLDMKNMAVYSKAGDPPQWKKSGDHADQLGFKELTGGITIAGKTVVDNADLDESDKFYTLTMPAEKTGDLVKDLHLLDRVDLGIADVSDITVEEGQIAYIVDKTTLRVHFIELKDVECRGKGTYEGASFDLKFMINGLFRFSRYNELKEEEYKIPPEVTEYSEN